jgi:general L-amino acid transport system permease protein
MLCGRMAAFIMLRRSVDSARPRFNAGRRGLAAQTLFLGALAFLAYAAAKICLANMRVRHIPVDFSFWNEPAGFDIDQHLVAYTAASTYGRAFLVGLLNTLLVSALGVVLASFFGFAIGAARLSGNLVIGGLAAFYVETMRNVPLLLQLLFSYNIVLEGLPRPPHSLALAGQIYLSNRGLFLPAPLFAPAAIVVMAACLAGLGLVLWAWVKGKRWPLALAIALPVAAYFAAGEPIRFAAPVFKGFNFVGGTTLLPEFVALLLGLSLYTAAFIAEIVRAGIQGVPSGQSEAAAALGLREKQARKYVIVPQALRLIVPPLTNEYLNLFKNSSLAVLIGYPDLMQIFAGTVLNQTGAAVPVILTTFAVYLAISLATSLAMNLYNHRIARSGA